MPPKRTSSHRTFNTSLLEPRALVSSGGLQVALRSIKTVCNDDDSSVMEVIVELNSRPHVLEYILSTLENQAYERLSKWIAAQFPTPATPNVMEALAIKLLRRLSSSLTSANGVLTAGYRNELREFRKKVGLYLDVLKELGRYINGASTDANVSPISRKRSKARARHTQLDPHPFDCMGIAVPMTEDGARVICGDILAQLQNILRDYLLVLRRPRVSGAFKHQLEALDVSNHQSGGLGTTAVPPESLVQLIRAGLYLENADGFGEWPILLSTRARKYLRKASRDGVIFDIVLKKMKELSYGHFSDDNQKKLTGTKTIIPVYEAKMTGDTRLVYHIGCVSDGEGETQAICVFGIFTHAQMDHGSFWDTVSKQLQNKGQDYIRKCTFRNKPLSSGDNTINPANFSWSPTQEAQEPPPLINACEEDLKNIHSMLVLDKNVILSQALLTTILADWEIPHVFTPSPQEWEIIENPSSCYVIGRSGTGKTTTILFKMLGIERAWKQSPDMWDRPRQIFVTQSRVLATKVEEYFSQLMLSLNAASYLPEELQAMGINLGREMEFIDLDDIDQWRPDLPRKFSELTDENFPLFITYNQLCLMLQNDIGEDNDNDGFIIPVTPITPVVGSSAKSPLSPWRSQLRRTPKNIPTPDYTEQGGEGFISYRHFRSQYWKHLPQSLTWGLDPALVFGQILGVIKGSEGAIGTKQRCLDRDTYLSTSGQGLLPHTKEVIYDLFIAYTRIKRQYQEYDAADRSHHLLKEFSDVGWKEEKGKKVDFLYIDEVQDNLLIDTLVLRTLCNNPCGLFWAGDTAQTISIGSSFKFHDLRMFQYRIETELYHGATPADPKTYELVVNHRSHGGIVNCARSVTDLIMLYWPHSIDILQPERAFVDGPKPMFFSNQGNGDLEKSFFGDGKGDPVEFGANQCVLVRNNDIRQQLKKQLKDACIIMTLNECKGLEFNDVLLYNFFADSDASPNQWRLVMDGSSDGTHNIPAPYFDETKHASICIELKFLYVAITRARNKLWFLDDCGSAMRAYWSSRYEIQIWEPTSEIPQFAEKSDSLGDWFKTGKMMFINKHYAQAIVAFNKAGEARQVDICYAYLFREDARAVPDDQVRERADAFNKAGEAFSACANEPQSQRGERLTYSTNAGECFIQGHRFKEAGSCFLDAEKYSKAACAYREGGHFDEMVEVLEGHADNIEAKLLAQLKKIAKMNYFKHGKVKKAQESLFSSTEEAISFAEDYGFDEVHVELLHTSGMVLESAEVLAKGGRVAEAVKALLATPRAPGHKRRAVEYLSTAFWQYQSFGMDHPTTDLKAVSELLELAGNLRNDMGQLEAREFAMFKARHKDEFQTLRVLYPKFVKEGNYSAALLCLDRVFASTLPATQGALTADPGPELSLHFAYFELLDRLRREDCLDTGSIRQKVFSFQPRQDDRFFIPTNSFLHTVFLSKPDTVREDGGFVVAHEELRGALDHEIPVFIHDRAKEQHNAYRRRLGAAPCMTYVTRGECRTQERKQDRKQDLRRDRKQDQKKDCQFQHLRPDEMTIGWFNARVQSVMMEMRILDLAGFYPKGVVLHWVCVLYSILHPPLPKFGSIATLDLGNTPESMEGIRILRGWIWQACDRLLFSIPPRFEYIGSFIPEFMAACTMAYDFDFERAKVYVPQTRMYRYGYKKWPACLTRPGLRVKSQLVVRDFVQLLQGGEHHSLILGTLYLRHIVVNRIPVEVGPFCDAVERLCGLFIMAHRVTTGQRTLHDVILPRSWFINLSRLLPALDKNIIYLRRFATDLTELLRHFNRRLDLQREHPSPQTTDNHQFIHNGSSLGPLYASMYIPRICLCLCLLGYNTNDLQLKNTIVQAIHELRRTERVNLIYRQYAEAHDWPGLVYTFTRSLSDSQFDEMILLLHSKAPKFQGWVPQFVRTVKYENVEEIPDRLRTKIARRPDTRAPANPPPSRPTPKGHSTEPGKDDGRQKRPELPEDGISSGEVPVDNGGQEEVFASLKEIKAALKIEAAYHRFMTRKKEALNGIDATRARLWSLLHDRASSMKWQKREQYKLLMQGPLVHVLVCIDGIKMFAEQVNKDSKGRIKGDDHKKLEELIDMLDQSSDLQRAAAGLQMKLGCSSSLHDGRNVSALKAAVLEVERLVGRLSEFSVPTAVETKERIKEDWKLGWDGIVKGPTSARKAQRPKLTLGEKRL